ncbi:MAG: methionine--tRNA ligase [Rhodospirillaceae bacterium]|jgi:methionyl-tRNA synthetase|nr:methionine--tRNA ligase [Rhodospirillaceae bacterium]
MSEKTSYYITTPIYYVNDNPHIGHAYTTLACDVLARFKRLDGFDVKFLTGTDEHGQKIEKSARAKGMAPQIFTDMVSKNFHDLTVFMNYSNNDFIRTTEPRHIHACQAFWKKLIDNNQVYLDKYCGWYSVRDESFWSETEIKFGINGEKLAPTGSTVEWIEEPSYFFKLSSWQDRLLDFYEANPNFIAPSSRKNEVLSFVKSGLKDLSISRTGLTWGIQVPDNSNHIIYVWLDALINYITAVGYPEITDDYKKYWPVDLNVIGKDILRFHAVYWPAFLMAIDLPLPKRIFAHGWWTNEGEKISKSLNNTIDPIELVQTYGLDQVRYFLLREMSFGSDGDFSRYTLIKRINSELANDLGNLAQRSLSMINKNCEAHLPYPRILKEDDLFLLNSVDMSLSQLRNYFDNQMFCEGIKIILQIVCDSNRYIDRQSPWLLKKTNPERMDTVLYVLAETIRKIALLLQPVMPCSMSRLLDQLSVPIDNRDFVNFYKLRTAGISFPKPESIFPRIIET